MDAYINIVTYKRMQYLINGMMQVSLRWPATSFPSTETYLPRDAPKKSVLRFEPQFMALVDAKLAYITLCIAAGDFSRPESLGMTLGRRCFELD